MRVWILDLPGFGYSDKPRRAVCIDEQASLVAEWLAAAGCRPARVLGNSFGSQIAAALAARHPGVVGRVVLLSPTLAPAVRRRVSWMGVLPGLAGTGGLPAVDWLAGRLERLPVPVVQAVYRRAGWADAITAGQLRRVRSERLADWVVRHYPRRRYPVVFIGSSNGAMAHLAAALGAPWLPQTLLLAVRHGGLDPDDPAADMQAMRPAGRALLESNPDLALHHMHA
jgi:pimeloyl-ACP methyl ester carboxylesterase